VNGWPTIFLAVIALATLAMAAVQIVIGLWISALMKRLTRQMEEEIKPVLANVSSITGNAARVAALAVAQVERADRLIGDVARRVDETTAVIQSVLVAPAREGRAVLAALAAALSAFSELRRGRGRSRSGGLDDEDPLFIG
jgi:hypothetical protein